MPGSARINWHSSDRSSRGRRVRTGRSRCRRARPGCCVGRWSTGRRRTRWSRRVDVSMESTRVGFGPSLFRQGGGFLLDTTLDRARPPPAERTRHLNTARAARPSRGARQSADERGVSVSYGDGFRRSTGHFLDGSQGPVSQKHRGSGSRAPRERRPRSLSTRARPSDQVKSSQVRSGQGSRTLGDLVNSGYLQARSSATGTRRSRRRRHPRRRRASAARTRRRR